MRVRAPAGLSRTTKILWVVTSGVATGLIAIIVVAALWDRGGTSRRDDVARYIEEVNTAQVSSAQQANTIAVAYSQFRTRPLRSSAQARQLARAEQAMRVVRARVAQVDAPPDALPLRAKLLRLLGLEVAFAGDVKGVAAYFPRAGAIDARAGAAGARLSTAVSSARSRAQEVDAFATYARVVGKAADDLARLRAPQEFERARRADVARLRGLQTSAAEIAAALRGRDASTAAARIEHFLRLAQSRTVALEQRRAVIAYDRRLRAIDKQRTAVQNELARLERTL
jgi:hypothetical protein